MNARRLITIAAVAASFTGVPALACDFHGAGFGAPYGMQWEPYTAEQNPEDRQYTPVASKSDVKKAKPVFSTVASRASTIAKRRVLAKSDKEAKSSDPKQLAEVQAK